MGNCLQKRKKTSSLVFSYITCNVCASKVTKYCSFNCNHKICHICLGFFNKNVKVPDYIMYNDFCNLCKLQDFIKYKNIN